MTSVGVPENDLKSESQQELSQGNLLIVDDESEIRDLLAESLASVTKNIQTAENGRVALDLIRSGTIDAVLSDVQMPIMNGLLLLSEIRRMSLMTPFVILTSHGDKKSLLEAMRLNATDFLEKPFDRNQVSQVVQRALDLGVELRAFEKELDASMNGLALPADEISRRKQIKMTLFAMKFGRSKA